MFYKYSAMTGRLTPSSQFTAYQPQGLMPYSEPAHIVYDTKANQPLRQAQVHTGKTTVRMAGSSSEAALGNIPSGKYEKTLTRQTFLLSDAAKLVWQKKSADRMAMLLSSGAMAAGTCVILYKMFEMVFPSKND